MTLSGLYVKGGEIFLQIPSNKSILNIISTQTEVDWSMHEYGRTCGS